MPQGCLLVLPKRFRGFTLGFVPESLYRVELFTWTSYLAQAPPPGAISAPFGTRPRRIRLLCSPTASRMPSPCARIFCKYARTISASPTFFVPLQWVERSRHDRAPVVTAPAPLDARGRARPGYCSVAKPNFAPGQPYIRLPAEYRTYRRSNSLPLSTYYNSVIYI